MNRMIRKMLPIVLSAAVFLPATSAFAGGDWRGFHPNQIVITENTPLYDVELPGSKLTVTPTGAALAPQVVTCTGGWNGTLFAVETWLGTKWVSSSNRIYGKNPTPVRFISRIPETMYLYDEPFADKKTGFAIAPQDVEEINSSDVGNQVYALIHTWLGDKWIRLQDSTSPVRQIKRCDSVSNAWVDMGDPTSPNINQN